jgi:hypothetical protein
MARGRGKDGIEPSDSPSCVTDPGREAELVSEFQRRLAYIAQSYRLGRFIYTGDSELNHAIRALKSAQPARRGNYRRLPPMIEVAVSEAARRFARRRTGRAHAPVEGEDIKRASKRVAMRLTPISHRPRADNLTHHVRGLMALIHEVSGRSVIAMRYLNSVYDPQFSPGASQMVPMFFQNLEPSATITQLVNIAENARKEWAGRQPSFREYFPGYGLRMSAEGSLVAASGEVVAHFKPNVPTYFR